MTAVLVVALVGAFVGGLAGQALSTLWRWRQDRRWMADRWAARNRRIEVVGKEGRPS